MYRNKIYGIDLGTTNSIIGCDNKLITRLMSSKVDLETRRNVPSHVVGDAVVGSYKVDIGLGEEGILSIDASSITLQSLVDAVKQDTGDIVKDVIISVPAYFSSNQRMAVRLAAEKIGLNLINVINEPTAAAIQICGFGENGYLRRGVFAVYDLGGGTFDCTVIDSRSGKYHVVGTDGCILGGDDLDRAIANHIISELKVPFFKRTKTVMAELIENCKEWKLNMQQSVSEFQPDEYTSKIKIPISILNEGDKDFIILSLSQYKKFVRDTFKKTITILTNLIESKIPKGTDFKVVFVGGSTHCSYLCSYVLSTAGISYLNAEFDKSPDYTVALGVVKYATSIQNGNEDVEFRDVTKQLSIEDKDGKAVVIIPANTNIPCTKKKIVTNSTDTDNLKVKLYQGNSLISANNEYIGYLEYDYGNVVKANNGDVEVTITVDIGGFITLEVEDIVNFGEKKSTKLRGF